MDTVISPDDEIILSMKTIKPDNTPDSFTCDFADTGKGELMLNVGGIINSGNVS